MRKTSTLQVLSQHGLIERGTVIEIIPDALPVDSAGQDQRTFRAEVVNPSSARDSIKWELDGLLYSPSSLTNRLYDEFGVRCLEGQFLRHWRRVGEKQSLWDDAEQFPR